MPTGNVFFRNLCIADTPSDGGPIPAIIVRCFANSFVLENLFEMILLFVWLAVVLVAIALFSRNYISP